MESSVTVTTSVPAPAEHVWRRVTTFEGVNHELGPWLSMTLPKGLEGLTVETAPTGQRLGRSWVLAFRIVPIDYDDLMLAELGPGYRFLERSRLATMRTWQHERMVTDDGDASIVTDVLTFDRRLLVRLVPVAVVKSIIRRLFEHRHRRLRALFSSY